MINKYFILTFSLLYHWGQAQAHLDIQIQTSPDLQREFPLDQPDILVEQSDVDYIQSIDSIWRDGSQKSELFTDEGIDGEPIITVESEQLKERLETLNQKSQINIPQYNTTVHAAVESYLRMGKYLGKVFALAEFYFPLFEEILTKYDIPKELKYLAIVESNLNAKAISRAGAQGIWQFIPETGRLYELYKTGFYDDRNDPVQATEAACRYLKDLYARIGDWALVLAAYNAGPGTVERALQRSGGEKDFWHLQPYLPRETRNYVPKFIAVNYVMNYYKEHNILPEHLHLSYDQTEVVPIDKKVSLNLLAEELDIPREELTFLNPQYVLGIVPKGDKFSLRLPKDKIVLFAEKEDILYARGENIPDHIFNCRRYKKSFKNSKKSPRISLAFKRSRKKYLASRFTHTRIKERKQVTVAKISRNRLQGTKNRYKLSPFKISSKKKITLCTNKE
ncbi:MAG: lytic transglycosylase domain-containing protein [Flavobacteriales bacterium]